MNYNTDLRQSPSSEATPAPAIILASASHSRRQLLERLGLSFIASGADIDETAGPGEQPADLVERLSRAKAAALQAHHPEAIIIGSDQVAVFDGIATSKPETVARAALDLRRFSGQAVEFLTGLCVLEPGKNTGRYSCDTTRVVFRNLEDDEIQRYLAHDRPLDCAGAFRLESLGPALFESVNSNDPTALLGLPLIALCRMLRTAGLRMP